MPQGKRGPAACSVAVHAKNNVILPGILMHADTPQAERVLNKHLASAYYDIFFAP
jgi:hypothetical protein